MKKILLMAAVAVMSVGSALAQFNFGAKAGFDLTNFNGSDLTNGMKPSYSVGVFAEYKFCDKFGVAPEVMFASQGGKAKTKGSMWSLPVSESLTFNTNYVNIPVMLKWYPTSDLSIDFGPQVGINVYSKITYEASLAGESGKETTDVKDDTKNVDFALGIGATYNVTDNVFIQARYTYGLTKTFKDDIDATNGNVFMGVGVKF